jgi:hypothetical protein
MFAISRVILMHRLGQVLPEEERAMNITEKRLTRDHKQQNINSKSEHSFGAGVKATDNIFFEEYIKR